MAAAVNRRSGAARLRAAPAVVLLGTVAALLAGCTGGGSNGTGAASGSATAGRGAATGEQSAIETVIQHVLPSVVEIQSSSGLGSGVVYDTKGDIVTNAHVVGSDQQFRVLTSGSATPLPARLVGSYPPNDLAVVAVNGAQGLRPATFADSASATVGETVLAMGNPLGLNATVTDGIVSATGRTVTEPGENGAAGTTLTDMIQTSAAINPGNSGGALVDLAERVLGIPTLAAVSSQEGGAAAGIGFAIPSNQVKNIADQLIAQGTVTNSGRAALGVQVTTVVDQSGAPQGCGVVAITPGGPADTAGIKPGDLIVAVNGKRTPTTQELSAVLAGLKPGQTVPVTVSRGGGQQRLNVTLGQL